MIKLGAKELRTTTPAKSDLGRIKKNPIYIILDSVLDTYNVGGIFRLADAVGAEKVFLCGQTETPPNSRIKKASINTTEWVTWSYSENAVGALQELKSQPRFNRGKIIAIEQTSRSILYSQAEYQFPIAFVVGNETLGVSKEALELADSIVEIPMWGVNKSLNVIISLAIVLYKAMKN